MLKNYLVTALRTFRRQKGYSFLNVLGLSVGLACSFFILLWVQDELSYDRFHEDGDQLYRVMRNYYANDQVFTWSAIPMPLAQVLEEDYPEITHAELVTWDQEPLFTYGDQTFRESGRAVGASFFEIFSFPFLLGDPASALDDPDAIVLSESLARKYFGPDWQTAGNVLGRTITIDHQRDVKVAGVFADVPARSTLQFDFVVPIDHFIEERQWLEHWGNNSLRLFVRLRQDADPATVSAKIKDVIREHHESTRADLFLQPYTDIHLYSDFKEGKLMGGRIEYVRIFGVVAIFILLIACINFMNLATARSARRAREIGVRKAIGATQRSLVGRFVGESVLTALLALVLALGLVALLLPTFNSLTGKAMTLLRLEPSFWLTFLGIAVGTGLLAGSYPAFYLAAYNVIDVLRGRVTHRSGGAGVRKGLVVFQFALSTLLIVGTLTVYAQMHFIHNANLGMERENLLYVRLEGGVQEQFDAFRTELAQQPGIASITRSDQNPFSVGQSTSDPTWDGKDPESKMLFHIIDADYDFIETMKMEMAEGRSFSRAFGADSVNYVVNEAAVRAMDMDEPLGQHLSFWGQEGEIVGVVKDFHMTSMYEAIEPTIIRLDPDRTWMLLMRTEAGQTEDALAGLETVYKQFNPAYPFEYRFFDQEYEQMYESEAIIGTLANVFAVLAVFIACLGLFGLAAFTAEQRTKEIGIRKVLGASVSGLVLLLSKDFTRLVLAAFVLTVPIAYFVMQEWLSQFAYRIDLSWGIFLVAGLAALGIAWLTVSYQSVRAALANPVESLRME